MLTLNSLKTNTHENNTEEFVSTLPENSPSPIQGSANTYLGKQQLFIRRTELKKKCDKLSKVTLVLNYINIMP
jgi:hypothetical protein